MSRRYTDEALSRVLGEHAAGQLTESGAENWDGYAYSGQEYPRSCANQAAFNERCPAAAASACATVALWFDNHYRPTMRPETLLREIEVRAPGPR